MKLHADHQRLAKRHAVLDRSMTPPFPEGSRIALFGMGCFWGAEKLFWQRGPVYTTAVGYAGGRTDRPDYRQVCSGTTGHAEVVMVVFEDDDEVLAELLDIFWEGHDPTQGMRQGNDVGSQYRSAVFVDTEHDLGIVAASRDRYQAALTESGYGRVTTEIASGRDFYYAEDYHQQYLAKNPAGYCGLGGTGVCMPAAS